MSKWKNLNPYEKEDNSKPALNNEQGIHFSIHTVTEPGGGALFLGGMCCLGFKKVLRAG